MRQKLLLIVTGLFLMLNLSGCWLMSLACLISGNGEGYSGCRPSNPPEPPPPSSFQNSQEAGLVYHWVSPGHTCQDSEGNTKSSYRGAILVQGDRFRQFSDECTKEVIYEGKVDELDQADDLIGFKEGIYQRWKK